MMRLEKINKYFNKNRSNENHVLKNISLDLPQSGLVVILGESGSGKTTLLNVISGMDKFNSGKIVIEGEIISKYSSKKWDEIRNSYIGYIFQNYNLLKDLTVQDNIELVLKINGIDDQTEITKRVNYLLESVGLLNYNDRRADQLSGGQQQRVGFARALVKNPKVILADEPTGNLDSKTTIEIMNIIKKISQNKLVIMVTHEQELADFYADRIIEVSNGSIVRDEKNDYKGNLSIIQEQVIYLKDLRKSNVENQDVDLITYSDVEGRKLEKIGVQVIKRNDTLYVKVDPNNYRRIKYIDKDSEIELIDSHFEKADEDSIKFNLEEIIHENKDQKKRGVITFKDSFKYALRKMNNLSNGGKMLYFVLGLVGAVLSVSVGLIGSIYNVDDSSFVTMPRNYIRIYTENIDYDEVMAFEDYDFIREISFIDEPTEFKLETELFYQITNSIEIEAYPANITLLNEDSIIYGEYPDEGYGIVIDSAVADQLIRDYSERGIDSYEDILDCSFKLQASGSEFDINDESSIKFPIVGISNDNSPTVWMKEELIFSLIMSTLVDYHVLEDGFVLTSGSMPMLPKQLLLNEYSGSIREHIVPSNVGIATGWYEVAGTFHYTNNGKTYDSRLLMVSELEFMRRGYFHSHQYAYVNFEFLAFTDDPSLAIEELAKLGIEAKSEYLEDYDQYVDYEFEKNSAFYFFSLIGILASAVSIYFIMRSSLISRIYEVSVYRALGATKNNIRKMFIVEVVLTTTISSVIGFFITMILLLRAQSPVIEYFEIVRYPILLTIYGVIAIYLINTFFGLLPINLLMRKTPSEILSKYDL